MPISHGSQASDWMGGNVVLWVVGTWEDLAIWDVAHTGLCVPELVLCVLERV